jgi:hypothetical protein
MPARDPDPFVLLATAPDPAAADLCAALLRTAGIDSRLRGESLGPYRLTIGAMAATQVWVRASRVDDARSIVLEGDLAGLEPARPQGSPGAGEGPAASWVPGAAVLAALLLGLGLWLLLSHLF